MSFPRSIRVSSIIAAALLVACGGGGDGGTPPNPIPSDFTVTLSSSTISVVAGASTSITATIARAGSFTGTVDLSAESLPTGVTAVFTPAQVTSGTTQTSLAVTATAAVVPGNYTFTIRGRASGIADRTASVAVTVTAPPRIALATSPATGSVAQGASTTFSATLTRTNFTGAVSIAATGAPAGVTTSVTTAGDVSTVTVTAGAAAAVGTSTLTVTASGTGVANATATYGLTVTAAPAGSFTVAVAPTTLSVQQGANGQATVSITRTNFTAPISLSVTGAPAGVTSAFGQSTLNTETSTPLTLAVAGTVAPGTYPLSVVASSGSATQTASLSLTVTAAPAGSISLALAAAIPAIPQGSSAGVTVNITRANFAGAVTLVVAGAPAGVTTNISPNGTTTNQSVVSFTVGAATAPGSYGITITGSGTGIPDATVTGTLVVTAIPAIAISVAPAADSTQAGGSLTFTVNIARTNFTAPVSLAVSGAPAGVTTSVPTSPTSGNSATVNVVVSGATALGTYPLTISATATGVANAAATFSLKVIQPPVSSGNVTWSFGFCGAAEQPIWVAAQNATGSWQRVTGVANSYSFSISANGGVAYVTQNGADDYSLNLFYGSLSELQARGGAVCPTAATKTVLGSVAGLNAGALGRAQVTLGSASAIVVAPSTAFTLSEVASGVLDLVAARSTTNLSTFATVTDKLIIRRGLNPANGSTLPVLDFNAAEAFDPDVKSVSITNANGEMVSVSTVYSTGTGSSALLGSDLPAVTTTRSFYAVPTAKQATGDLHLLSGSAIVSGGSSNATVRTATLVFKDAVNQTLPLGATLATPIFSTVATSPYLRPRITLAQQADYSRFWIVGYTQGSGSLARAATILMTQGYLGSAAFDHTIPDFSGVNGWLNTWGLQAGTSVTYLVSASGWTLGGGGSSAPNVEGTLIRSGSRTGVVP